MNVRTVGVVANPVVVALQSAIYAHTKRAFTMAAGKLDYHIFTFLIVEADVAGSHTHCFAF